jgi:hypothetical protein
MTRQDFGKQLVKGASSGCANEAAIGLAGSYESKRRILVWYSRRRIRFIT